MSRESKVLIAILVVVVGGMVGLFAIANSNQSANQPKGDASKVVRDSSHKQGSGPVQLVEFGDYQCPSCGAAYPVIKQLQAAFPGKFTFYFRNFPLSSLHKNAMAGANAAESAHDQGKFWEMHDKLYETQNEWSQSTDPTDTFVTYAKGLGLDADKFRKALTDTQFQSVIDQDMADGEALGVNATPTFFFNGTKYEGKSTFEEMKAKVESLLNEQPAPTPTPAASPQS